MKQRTLRVHCVGCKTELDIYIDEDFGEAFGCRRCGITVSVNFDRNTIEVDNKKAVEM